MTAARWLRALCILGVVLCFTVVVLGAYVRLTAAGLGCPDWPGCYGHLTPSGAQSAGAAAAFPGRPLEPGKAWREMIHRYAVGTLSLIVILVTALAIGARRQAIVSVPLALALCATLITQALLGMLTVTWRLNPLTVTLHLLFGMTTLGLLWWLLLSLPQGSRGRAGPAASGAGSGGAATLTLARGLALLGLVALTLQIALGGWTSSNYAAIACPDFPTCQGAWWPKSDYRSAFVLWHGLGINYEGGILDNTARIAIHLTHRLGATITAFALALAAVFVLRRRGRSPARAPALAVLAALTLQLAIGISMVLEMFPLWLATAHTAGAALLLLATLALLRSLTPALLGSGSPGTTASSGMTVATSEPGKTGLARRLPPRWRRYLALTKPKVVALITFTAIVGTLLASPGLPPAGPLVWGNLGIALAAACAATLNHILDRRIDEQMARTRGRPLPTGQLSERQALVFAAVLGTSAMAMLAFLVNLLTAALTFLSLIGYAVIYTVWLKRATSQNIVIGGAAGAAPPVLGWTAVTGSVDPNALLLFLIIFVWTPPHFWALAIARRDDYARAGIPMLPVTHGVAYTRLQVLLYTVLLTVVTLMPYLTRMSGLLYLAAALGLNAGFLYYALALKITARAELPMRVFRFSVNYLMWLFAALLIDHYLPALRAAGP